VQLPKSVLGKMAPTALLRDGSLFTVLKSYFDKSGQEDQPLLTIGGIAANDQLWADIEIDWNDILQKNDPPASYMHMRDAIPLRGDFSPAMGWDDDHIFGLINLLISYLSNLPLKQQYCQFSASLKMGDYDKLREETYQMDSPADIVASSCVRQMTEWYFTEYKSLDFEAHYYFDQGEPFEEIIKAKWNRWRAEAEDSRSLHQWGHITHIGPAIMKKTPGLQIADMFAWATNRHEVKIPRRYDDLVIGLRHLFPSMWVVIDEKTLRNNFKPLVYNPYDKRQR
jgi:hypothetical protein